MLTGFPDIQTSLPVEMQGRAKNLARWLRDERRKVQSQEIVELGSLKGPKNNNPTVRAMVSYVRSLGDPDLSCIASSQDGYWWEPDQDKLEINLRHLRERSNKIMGAYRGAMTAAGAGEGR